MVTVKLLMVDVKRFCNEPNFDLSELTFLTALSTVPRAFIAEAKLVTSIPLSPNALAEKFAILLSKV